MNPSISRALNIVIPLERADGTDVFVHSTPVSTSLFNVYWDPLSQTFAKIMERGPAYTRASGPRIAQKMLEKVSTELGVWEGDGGVKRGLVAEYQRLTNVLVPGKSGWEMIPYHEAVRKNFIDPADVDEVEGRLAFFTVYCLAPPRATVQDWIEGMKPWGVQTTSLNCTEFMNSLSTSTETETSGETVASVTATPSNPIPAPEAQQDPQKPILWRVS